MSSPIFVSIETTAYSGATLLALWLGSHPCIATIGEMSGLLPRNDPDEYLCSCGEVIGICAFWRSVISAMERRGFELELDNFNTRFRFGRKLPRFFDSFF